MKRHLLTALCLMILPLAADPPGKPRLVVLTDISNEPDDEESLVRLLVCANEYDIEGLIATTSVWLKNRTREDLIRRDLDAYAVARRNLQRHAPGFPEAERLRAVTRTGQPGFGMTSVGEGKASAGSRLLTEAVDRNDSRPLWISVWGGANTLAQAMWDVRAGRSAAELDAFVAKLRVYAISDQDDAGHWLRREFPKLFYVVSPTSVGWDEYYRATWTGISGDRHYHNGVMHRFALVDKPWLQEHIHDHHGPLGELYPMPAYIMEGDTPSFLGLIDKGLGWTVRPDYGGWGGRYCISQPHGEPRRIWTDGFEARDTVTSDDNGRTETSNQATVWRWREAYQNDFAARMDWCVADGFGKANHPPLVVLQDDVSKRVIEIGARPGGVVTLSAAGTRDPDGNDLKIRWWIYPEASTLRDPKTRAFPESVKLSDNEGPVTRLVVPPLPGGKPPKEPATIHVILEVRDNGTPNLTAYRRAVITIDNR